MTTTLVTHCGARKVERAELDTFEAPPATKPWFPVKHGVVIDTVGTALESAGFAVQRTQLAVGRNGAQMFATLDLAAPLAGGAALAVGIRNSTDKSLPLGFVAGSRVFVCDNLAFNADLIVRRKHTINGATRFSEAIQRAVQSLATFQQVETARIGRLQQVELAADTADALILWAFERKLVPSTALEDVLNEWRNPSHPEFEARTLWSLFNCFTDVLGPRGQRNPQRYAALTMGLSALLDGAVPVASEP
jgi:hypothetical protein